MDSNEADEKCKSFPDHLAMKISGSPASNNSLPLIDQLTPVTRILQARKAEDIYQTESPGMSPSTPGINHWAKLQEYEQKIELLKKENAFLQSNLLTEQQTRENIENTNQDLEQKLKALNQKSLRNKKEIDELRHESDVIWTLTKERDDLMNKNECYRQRQTKYIEQEDTIAVLKRNLDDLTSRYKEVESEISTQKYLKCDVRQLSQSVVEHQQTIEEYQQTLTMQEHQISQFIEAEKQLKQEYAMLKELFDAQKLEISCRSGIGTPDVSFVQGESMTVVEIQELKEKIEEMQCNWLEPGKANDLKNKLDAAEKLALSEKGRINELLAAEDKHLSAIGSLEQENKQLRAAIKDAEDRFSGVQQSIEVIERNSEAVIANRENIFVELTELKGQLSAVVEERDAFEQKYKQLVEKTEGLQQEHANFIEQAAMLQSNNLEENSKSTSALQEVKTENIRLQQINQEHFETIQAMQISWTTPANARGLKSDLDATKSDLIKAQEKCQGLESNIRVLEKNISVAQNQVTVITSEMEKYEMTSKSLQAEKETLKREYEDEIKRLEAAMKDTLNTKDKEYRNQIEGNLRELSRISDDKNTEIDDLSNSLEQNKELLSAAVAKTEALEETLAELLAQKMRQSSENEKLKEEVNKMQIETAQKSTEMDTINKLRSEDQETLKTQEIQFEALKQEHSSRETEIKAELDEMKMKFSELVQTLQQDDSRILNSFNEKDLSFASEYNSPSYNYRNKSNSMGGVDDSLSQNMEENLRTAVAELETKRRENDEMSLKMSELNEALNDKTISYENATKQLNESKSTIEELQQNIADLQSKLQEQSADRNLANSQASEAVFRRESELKIRLEKFKMLEVEYDQVKEELGRALDEVESLKEQELTTRRELNFKDSEMKMHDERFSDTERQLVEAKVQHKFALESHDAMLKKLEAETKSKLELSESRLEHYAKQVKKTDAALIHQKVEYESKIITLERRVEELEFEISQHVHLKATSMTSFSDFNENNHALTPNKLLRSLSEDCLSTPTNKMDFASRVKSTSCDSLDDSLELFKSRVVSPRKQFLHAPDLSSVLGASTPNKSALSRSCLSVESSLLGPPLNQKHQQQQQMHAFSTGDLTNEDPFPSPSHLGDNDQSAMRRATLGPMDFKSHNGRPSLLGLPSVLEEPDDPNYSSSMYRIAELQKRNSKQLAHLKSSYPVETQTYNQQGEASIFIGKTLSKCDEAIRIGNARETIKKIDSKSLLSTTQRSEVRALPGYRSSSTLAQKATANQAQSSVLHGTKRKQEVLTLPHMQWQSSSPKNRRDTIAGPFLRNNQPEEIKRNPRRESTMFEIANTPPVNPGWRKRRNRKKQPEEQLSVSVSSKTRKTPEKSSSSRQKKATEAGKRTPSLMDRMRKPLGLRNSKK